MNLGFIRKAAACTRSEAYSTCIFFWLNQIAFIQSSRSVSLVHSIQSSNSTFSMVWYNCIHFDETTFHLPASAASVGLKVTILQPGHF
jgi:hypothetical protein